jgi:hypothetical protein
LRTIKSVPLPKELVVSVILPGLTALKIREFIEAVSYSSVRMLELLYRDLYCGESKNSESSLSSLKKTIMGRLS